MTAGRDGYKSGPGAFALLRGALIVVVQAAEDRDGADGSDELGLTRDRLPLAKRLMRACRVVERDELSHDVLQMRLAQEENVVEELSTQRACESLRKRNHVRHSRRAPNDSDPGRLEYASEPSPELGVAVADKPAV